MPPARVRDRRARSEHRLGTAAARRAARPARAGGRARARRLARADRVGRRPPSRLDPRRPGAGRARQAPPSTLSGLEQIRGLHPPTIKRRGRAILAAIARGREAAPIPRDEGRGRSDPGDAPLIALAEALLRARALDAGLAYELIASRAELELIVGAARRGEPEPDRADVDRLAAQLVGDDLRTCSPGTSRVVVGPRSPASAHAEPACEHELTSTTLDSNICARQRAADLRRALDPSRSRCPAVPIGRRVCHAELVAGRIGRRLIARVAPRRASTRATSGYGLGLEQRGRARCALTDDDQLHRAVRSGPCRSDGRARYLMPGASGTPGRLGPRRPTAASGRHQGDGDRHR